MQHTVKKSNRCQRKRLLSNFQFEGNRHARITVEICFVSSSNRRRQRATSTIPPPKRDVAGAAGAAAGAVELVPVMWRMAAQTVSRLRIKATRLLLQRGLLKIFCIQMPQLVQSLVNLQVIERTHVADDTEANHVHIPPAPPNRDGAALGAAVAVVPAKGCTMHQGVSHMQETQATLSAVYSPSHRVRSS